MNQHIAHVLYYDTAIYRTCRRMKVIGKLAVPLLVHATALEILGTIFLCYGLAVAYGHVQPWLPMISDCAVYPPEKYPFRYGFVVGAALICCQVVMIYFADKPYSNSKTSLVLGIVASFCLGVVGVVNEVECNPVHSGAAVIFFVSYEANMVILTWFEGYWTSGLAVLLRKICTIITGFALVAFVIMSTNWGKYSLYIAICEWVGTLCIILFNWSYASDLTGLYAAEVESTAVGYRCQREEKLNMVY